MTKLLSLCLAVIFFAGSSVAQIRKIPASVTTSFEKQYPDAQEVEYKDIITSIHVHFLLDSTKMVARYTPKGEWKESEKVWSFDSLSPDVQDGFQKSKYADEWRVTDAAIIYLPGGGENYRVKVEKNDLQKKYLFFNNKGRLVREALTI